MAATLLSRADSAAPGCPRGGREDRKACHSMRSGACERDRCEGKGALELYQSRATAREKLSPGHSEPELGFRCVRGALQISTEWQKPDRSFDLRPL
jgi:hypothetical protein